MSPLAGVARNFDWGVGGKMEKNCDVFLVTFFGNVMSIMILKPIPEMPEQAQ